MKSVSNGSQTIRSISIFQKKNLKFPQYENLVHQIQDQIKQQRADQTPKANFTDKKYKSKNLKLFIF